jgi:hypothetical protein
MAAPLALAVMMSTVTFIEAVDAAEQKRPTLLQAVERFVGGAKKQAAEKLSGAPKKAAAEAPPAEARPEAATTARADSGGAKATQADSAKSTPPRSDAERVKGAKDSKDPRPAKGAPERDTAAKKTPGEKEEVKDEAPVRGPRLPVWPGITLANPAAPQILLAAK